MLGLFQISTTEGWVDLMYAAVDSAGIDMQPRRGNRPIFIYFFVLFIIAGNFFALNLFVGVLLENFHRLKNEHDGFSLMTPEQQDWVKIQRHLIDVVPQKAVVIQGSGRFNMVIQKIISHAWFEYFVQVMVMANAVVLALDHWGQSDEFARRLDQMNYLFVAVFSLECAMKLWVLRMAYFRSFWNRFDFVVVVGTDIGIVLVLLLGRKSALLIKAVRILRVCRLVRLLTQFKQAHQILKTILLILPGLVNIGALLLLAFFIYAIVGNQLFAKWELNQSFEEHANFQTFGIAMLTLFRFLTGEAWGQYMYDASANQPGCVSDPPYNPSYCGFNNFPGCIPLNGCGNNSIFPYLMTFILFVQICLYHLFISVIIEGFHDTSEADTVVTLEDLEAFCNHWIQFDPHVTMHITVIQLEEFIRTLFQPLGFGAANISRSAVRAQLG